MSGGPWVVIIEGMGNQYQPHVVTSIRLVGCTYPEAMECGFIHAKHNAILMPSVTVSPGPPLTEEARPNA